MPLTNSKPHEALMNSIWQKNLGNAREIHIDVNKILDDSFDLVKHSLHEYHGFNETDRCGLLLALLTCIGHVSANSNVHIRNHTTNLNLFLLLIGPSGNGDACIHSSLE